MQFINRKGIIFHHDNVRSHSSLMSPQILIEQDKTINLRIFIYMNLSKTLLIMLIQNSIKLIYQDLKNAVQLKRPKFVNRKVIVFHHDNVRSCFDLCRTLLIMLIQNSINLMSFLLRNPWLTPNLQNIIDHKSVKLSLS